jgi:hypothetical protein
MTGAEGLSGLQLDGKIIGPHGVPVMRAMHQKPPGAHRFEPFERFGDPVGIAKGLELDRGIGKLFGNADGNPVSQAFVRLSGGVDRNFPEPCVLVDLHSGQWKAFILEGRVEQIQAALCSGFVGAEIVSVVAHVRFFPSSVAAWAAAVSSALRVVLLAAAARASSFGWAKLRILSFCPGEFEAAVANEIAPDGLTHNRMIAPSGRDSL